MVFFLEEQRNKIYIRENIHLNVITNKDSLLLIIRLHLRVYIHNVLSKSCEYPVMEVWALDQIK